MTNMTFSLIFSLFLLYSCSDAPPVRHDFMLAATMDGTVSLLDLEGPTILWSVDTGGPIYSSYQHSEVDFRYGDGIYIDCDDDWNLYRHDRTKGTIERVGSAGSLLMETDKFYTDATSVWSQVNGSRVVVDANDGTVVFNSYLGSNESNVIDKSKTTITIFRIDYTFEEINGIYRKILWNVSLAEFHAHIRCPKVESSSCKSGYMDVKRVRGGFSEF